jgi:hypothetical protein
MLKYQKSKKHKHRTTRQYHHERITHNSSIIIVHYSNPHLFVNDCDFFVVAWEAFETRKPRHQRNYSRQLQRFTTIHESSITFEKFLKPHQTQSEQGETQTPVNAPTKNIGISQGLPNMTPSMKPTIPKKISQNNIANKLSMNITASSPPLHNDRPYT